MVTLYMFFVHLYTCENFWQRLACVSTCWIQTYGDISGACCLILFIHFYPYVFFLTTRTSARASRGCIQTHLLRSPFSCHSLSDAAKPMYINNISSVYYTFYCNAVALSDRLFVILSNIS